jgi:diaminohydroxyphosphoribosylaminopyrimidine deaminase/5-amino-6-(5-phosphoribosylamino)uracil reductase
VTLGHILRVTERRPLVQLKLALSAAGEVSRGGGGKPQWVTGGQARAHGHRLRAEADAILVGHGTVRDDDPDLTCRLPGLEARSPLRVVLAGSADDFQVSRLYATSGAVPVRLYCARSAAGGVAERLAAPGLSVKGVASVGGRLWLPAVLEDLVAEGVTRLMVEGGPAVWRAFGGAGLYDEIALYLAGSGDGGADEERTVRAHLARHGITGPLARLEQRRVGSDSFWLFARA